MPTWTHQACATHRWYAVRVQQRGDAIQASVDGHRLIRFVDTQNPYLSGRVGLYTEDASATFHPVAIHAAPGARGYRCAQEIHPSDASWSSTRPDPRGQSR